jgi:hypothetical protein
MDVNLGTVASQPGWGIIISPLEHTGGSLCFTPSCTAHFTQTDDHRGDDISDSLGHKNLRHVSESEASESSNARELLATLYSFKIGIGFLRGMRHGQHGSSITCTSLGGHNT